MKKYERMDDVIVIRPFINICHIQACVKKTLSDKEIVEKLDKIHPSGTDLGWTRVIRGGKNKPVQCETYEDRLHVLVRC